MLLTPKFFRINKLSLLSCLLWQKIFSFPSKKVGRFFYPRTAIPENGSSLLYDVTSGFHSPTKAQTVRNCKVDPIFSSSQSVLAVIVKKGYSMHSSAIFWPTFVVTSKSNSLIRRPVKKESYLSSFVLVSLVNETLRWRHKANLTHSPALSSMGQESAQLLYFEKVQHSKEKPRAKNVFAKVIRTVARVYLCGKKSLGVSGSLNSSRLHSKETDFPVTYKQMNSPLIDWNYLAK